VSTFIRTSYRADIDGLRAIAVVAVLIYHAFPILLGGGYVGVDIFFVISGFLISKIIINQIEAQKFSIITFYNRRARRIFPALIFMLVTAFILGKFILSSAASEKLGMHMMASTGFVQNILLYSEDNYFNGSGELKPLLHLWSLGIEEQFYIFWPLLIIIFTRLKFNLWILILLLSIISFASSVIAVDNDRSAAFFLLQNRTWELLFGGIIALWCIKKGDVLKNNALAEVLSIVGFSLILYSLITLTPDSNFPGYLALPPVIGTGLIILAGPDCLLNRHILSSRFLVLIGLISFPLYLWHWPLLVYNRIAQSGSPSDISIACILVLSFVMAYISYAFVEKPVRYGVSKISTQSLYAALVVVAAIGFYANVLQPNPTFPTQNLLGQKNGGLLPLIQPLDGYNGSSTVSQWRDNKCFLNPKQNASDWSTDCVNLEYSSAPLIALWGDSNAASLVPGLLSLERLGQIRLAQFTSSGCPPIMNMSLSVRPECKGVNDFFLPKILEYQPDIVILSAQSYSLDVNTLSKLAKSIHQLQSSGIKNIILIGPSPTYPIPLPEYLLRYNKDGSSSFPLKVKRSIGAWEKSAEKKLPKFAQEIGVRYLSIIDTLCKTDGCISRVSNNDEFDDITQFDQHHLTAAGSRFVINNLIDEIVK